MSFPIVSHVVSGITRHPTTIISKERPKEKETFYDQLSATIDSLENKSILFIEEISTLKQENSKEETPTHVLTSSQRVNETIFCFVCLVS